MVAFRAGIFVGAGIGIVEPPTFLVGRAPFITAFLAFILRISLTAGITNAIYQAETRLDHMGALSVDHAVFGTRQPIVTSGKNTGVGLRPAVKRHFPDIA